MVFRFDNIGRIVMLKLKTLKSDGKTIMILIAAEQLLHFLIQPEAPRCFRKSQFTLLTKKQRKHCRAISSSSKSGT